MRTKGQTDKIQIEIRKIFIYKYRCITKNNKSRLCKRRADFNYENIILKFKLLLPNVREILLSPRIPYIVIS